MMEAGSATAAGIYLKVAAGTDKDESDRETESETQRKRDGNVMKAGFAYREEARGINPVS